MSGSKQESGVHTIGRSYQWHELCGLSSRAKGWSRKTRVMPLRGGCLVEVYGHQGKHIAQAVVHIPGATLEHFDFSDEDGAESPTVSMPTHVGSTYHRRSLGNRTADETRENTPDLEEFGDPDLWRLHGKAHNGIWMRSTRVMPLEDLGCLVLVSSERADEIAESLVFIPGACLEDFIVTDEA